MSKTLVMALGTVAAVGVGVVGGALLEKRTPLLPDTDVAPAAPTARHAAPSDPAERTAVPPDDRSALVDVDSLARFLSFAEEPQGLPQGREVSGDPMAAPAQPAPTLEAAPGDVEKKSPGNISTAINTGDVSIRFTNVKNAQDLLLAVGEVAPLSCRPIARVQATSSARPNSPLLLDGTASYDSCGLPLSYRWELARRPADSATVPACPDCALTSLPVDRAGDYEVTLVVSNGRWDSPAAVVRTSTSNGVPRAAAGPDVPVRVGQTVTLDGSLSRDPDGDALRYSWSFLERPAGSTATLDDAAAQRPSFEVDLEGTYVVQLVVFDEVGATSEPDEVRASTENVVPVAHPGSPQAVFTGTTVVLDGSSSSDANNDRLRFRWAFVSKPDGSTATIDQAYTSTATFVPDRPGLYIIGLVAHDGMFPSLPARTVIVGTSGSDCALTDLRDALAAISKVQAGSLCSPDDGTLLSNTVAAAITSAETGDRRGASQLTEDALRRVDGCALRGKADSCFTPDGDWITTCVDQGDIHPLLTDALACLINAAAPDPQPPAPGHSGR